MNNQFYKLHGLAGLSSTSIESPLQFTHTPHEHLLFGVNLASEIP